MSNGPPSRDRRSLQELAKLASSPTLSPASSKTPAPPSARTPPPSSVGPVKSENDSGIVDLNIIANTDLGAAERAKTTPLASQGIFDESDDNPSIAPPPMSTPPASAKVPSQNPAKAKPKVSAVAAAAAPPSKSNLMVPVVVGLGLAALATVGFMVTRPAKDEVAKNLSSETTPAMTPKRPPINDPTMRGAAPAPATTAAAAADPGTDPGIPAAGGDSTKAAGTGARAVRGGNGTKKGPAEPSGPGGSGVSQLSAMMAQATNSPTTAPVAGPESVSGAPASPGALNEAMQHAVGANGAPPPVAAAAIPGGPAYAAGSVPEKPSQGAVTSALNRALPTARNCLNADDPVSRANVTFSSAGTVSSVVVTGSAAGKPAEECIKGAMMQASVAPFAQATYSANVTVRPN